MSFEEPKVIETSSERELIDLLGLNDTNTTTCVDFDAVSQRSRSHPNEAQVVYSGKTILQIAVTKKNVSYAAISAIIAAHPPATLRSPYSTSSLFDSCRCNASPDIIALILRTSLQQREVANVPQFSPFTWISDIQVSIPQAQLMLDIHPSGATDKDDYLGGINALNQLIDDWDWLVHDVEEYPHGGTRSTTTLDVKYEKLQLLLRAKDKAAGDVRADTGTFCPLHSLLRYCLYDETAKADSCTGYDFQGLLTIVNFMAKVDPKQFAAREYGKYYGDLPLHVIVKSKPKHQCGSVASAERMADLVRTVLYAYPRAVVQKDADRSLPLHLAVSNQACIGSACCKILVDAAPQILAVADGVSGLYPFQAAAVATSTSGGGLSSSSDTSQIELVHKMLIGAPHVLNHNPDKAGEGGRFGTIQFAYHNTNISEEEKLDAIEFASENVRLGRCKDDVCRNTEKELQKLRERTAFLERENIKLRIKGSAGEFGSPIDDRKKSSTKSAWV